MSYDFRDFYIRYPGHPDYRSGLLIQDDVISVILQKYEMLIFTNQGELLGDPNFGCNLEELLFETRVDSSIVQNNISDQITQYIPELDNMNYQLNVAFMQDPNNYQDMMVIRFQVADYEVYTQIGNTYGGF
jgi:hypothetical protein